MKKATLIFMLLICTLIGCSNIKSENDRCQYNDMFWGTTKENIIKEKGEPVVNNSDNSIRYYELYMGDFFYVSYCFDEQDKLNEIKINIGTSIEYGDIRNMLTEKFGEPSDEMLDENNDGVNIADWFVGNTLISVFDVGGECDVWYSLITDIDLTETVEMTTEATTIDTLKYEVADTYNKIWDMVDKSSDLYAESVNVIANDNLSGEDALKITNDNDELVGQYIEEVSKYLDVPTYDDEYAFAAYDYLSLIRVITLNCYSYEQTKNKYYIEEAKIAINSIMDKYGKVMEAQRNMPEKAGYSLAEILVAVDEMETATVN